MSLDGGAFSSYLVGTYEIRFGMFTMLQIINPTALDDLEVIVALFDADENVQICGRYVLSANDMEVINIAKVKDEMANVGVIKIFSHRDGRPARGIVGFQRQVLPSHPVFSETVLAAVPTEVAEEELPTIMNQCEGKWFEPE